ncbi:hypothetical protein OIU85_001605 [Salix viminalis]|uniref:Uncharacterized protein n=1 Tax=Salix viminalis TaxID=40686 RepID=A0A9Q0VLN3_SALVM|nr:hypothetical protein OIU85_001605 [Salix viminalis]
MNWPQSQATFQARIHSDHSLIILTFMPSPAHHRCRFKFLNLWTDQDGYKEMIQVAWGMAVFGNPIYRLATKLRTFKGYFSNFHRRHTNCISSRVQRAEQEWKEAQVLLDRNPNDQEAHKKERICCNQFAALSKAEESFFKQRSRMQWLQLGDRNTAFFHRSLLHRHHRNGIHSLLRDDGEEVRDPEEIGNMAVSFY